MERVPQDDSRGEAGAHWRVTRTPTRPAVALGLFTIAVAVIYLLSPVIHSGDGRLVVYEAHSELHQQNTDLSEYGAVVDGFPCYRVKGRRISRYPVGTSLVAAPLLLLLETGGRIIGHDPTAHLKEHPPRDLEKTLASLIAALGCLTLALLALQLTNRLLPALLVGALFAFGTGMWSTVSRGLWQHGPLILLVGIALNLLVLGQRRDDWRWSAAAGVPLGAAFAVRPTVAVALAFVALHLVRTNRRAAIGFVAGAAAMILPTLALNEHLYGSLLNPFYFDNGDSFIGSGLRSTFLTGLAGTMVSPARGLLIYSPFVLLALAGPMVAGRRPNGLERVALGTVAAMWLVVSNTYDWPGGWSYGPRLLVDAVPWLALLMIPALDVMTTPRAGPTRARRLGLGVLAILVGWSVFVNAQGALSWSVQGWNMHPVGASVAATPDRFWDWSDPPFLRADGSTFKDIYPDDRPPAIPPDDACLKG
jgi:hypothetical protein